MADPVTCSAFWDLKATEVLKFISGFVSSVAWPMAAFFILRLFREELLKLIPFLSKLSVLGISAEFSAKLDAAEAEVAKIPEAAASSPATAEQHASSPDEIKQPEAKSRVRADFVASYRIHGPVDADPVALRANPTGVVMESWKTLENDLTTLAFKHKIPLVAFKNAPRALIKILQKDGVITQAEFAPLMELLDLRNLAAHSQDRSISEAEAKRFSELASTLSASLRTKAIEPPEDRVPA